MLQKINSLFTVSEAHEIKKGTFSYRYCYCVYRTRYHAHDVYAFAVFLAKQDTNSIFNIRLIISYQQNQSKGHAKIKRILVDLQTKPHLAQVIHLNRREISK